jgi:LmbE family N-acetylglucosaminyl deacetylase
MTTSHRCVPEGVARVLHDRRPAVFVSPHLDDAVLSCAALMRTMAERAPVTVVTLFSAAGPEPHTRAARTFLRQCGATDAADLFAARRREDGAVLDGLGLGVRHVHLGHPDALFRRRRDPSGLLRRAGRVLPELDHRYPTFRFDIALGRVSRGDQELRAQLVAEVTDLARGAVVFAPLGVGRHVDHLLARSVGEHLGAVLYGDFPYTVRDPAAEAVAAGGRRPWAWADGLAARQPAIAGYRTQVDALFPDGEIPLGPETYYPSSR